MTQVEEIDAMIERFRLQPHPYDGWFAPVEAMNKAAPRYYYFLKEQEITGWHRMLGLVLYSHIDGAPLQLDYAPAKGTKSQAIIGSQTANACAIDPGMWRSLKSQGAWTLLIISLQNSDLFPNWQLAPDHWRPSPSPE
ncbi:MAG: cupin domain-containing protein [bacterium]